MKRVLKYQIHYEHDHTVVKNLMGFSRVVLFARQREKMFVWLEVNDDAPEPVNTSWEFRVYGTGDPITNSLHAHQASMMDGPFVWHLYGQRTEEKRT